MTGKDRIATEPDRPRRLVLKYYLYRAGVSVGFVTPVFTLFLLDRGLTYTAISALSGVYGVVIVLGELPTGYLGDRLGRRSALLAGSACTTVSVLGFAFVSGFGAFAGLYVLWGLGLAFRSGAGDAWLYEVLSAEGRVDGFTRVRGRGETVSRTVTLGATLAGGALFAIRPELPFLAAGLLNATGLVVVASFPRTGATGCDGAFTLHAASVSVKRYVAAPPLRSFVLAVGLVLATAQSAGIYVQPIATRVIGVQIESLGGLYAGMTLVAAASAGLAGPLRARLGAPVAVLGVGLCLATLLVVPIALPVLAVVAFLGLYGAGATLRPVASGFIGGRVEEAGRATVLSAASLVYALLRLPLVLSSGVVADAYGPRAAFAFLGVVCVGGLVLASTSMLPSVSGIELRAE